MRDFATGAIAGAVFGALFLPLMRLVFLWTLRVVIGRRPEAKRDWAPLIAATVAGVIAMAAQTLVVLLRPVTQDWRVFLAAYVPFLALAIVVQGRVRK